MKPPVLRIKKQGIVYDDTEAQQRSEPFRPDVAPRKRVSRRRRMGPRFSLFPLLVIAAGLFVFFRVLPHAQTNRAVLAGWQVTLRVTPYQDTLIVGLTLVSRSTGAAASVPEATARVLLLGTGEQVFLAGDLARSPMTLQGRLPNLPGARGVQAEVAILGSRVTLRAAVPASRGDAPSP